MGHEPPERAFGYDPRLHRPIHAAIWSPSLTLQVPSPDFSELRKRAGCRRQRGAGPGAVVVHLAHQRLDAVEFQFIADEGDEGDIQRCPVEVALEVEQEHFQQRRAVVEGRAAAETGDAVEQLAVMADPHRIDAVLEAAIPVEFHVGGGIAEVAAAFFAVDHFAGDEPRAVEHRRRILDLPFRQRHADRAGGDRALLDVDMRLHVDLDAEAGGLADQQARRADPALAEMKVVADRNTADAEPLDQIMVNEILRRGAGSRLVEGHDHGAGEPGSGQQAQLVGLAGQTELRGIGAEKAARMRLEGHGKSRPAVRARHLKGCGNDGTVAKMDAVEIAHRHHRSLGDIGLGRGVADNDETERHCWILRFNPGWGGTVTRRDR